MKMSNVLVGLIIITATIAIFMIFAAQLGSSYEVTYDNSTESYQKLDELSQLAQDIERNSSAMKEKTGALDVIGSFFSDGHKVYRLSSKSLDVMKTMSSEAIDSTDVGPTGPILKSGVFTILTIVIFLGLIIAAILGRDL